MDDVIRPVRVQGCLLEVTPAMLAAGDRVRHTEGCFPVADMLRNIYVAMYLARPLADGP